MSSHSESPSELEQAFAAFIEAEAQVPDDLPPDASSIDSTTMDSTLARQAVSDAALERLFAAMPQPVPAADFAGQVLRRAGVLRQRLIHRDLGWRGRTATAAAFTLVMLGTFWTLPAAFHLLSGFQLGSAFSALANVFSFLISALGDAFALAERFAQIGRILWLILTSPKVVLTLTVCAALTLLMGRWLAHLLSVPRSSLHVAAR